MKVLSWLGSFFHLPVPLPFVEKKSDKTLWHCLDFD